MPIKVTELENEPIVILTVLPPVDSTTDPQATSRATDEFKAKWDRKIARITDYRSVTLTFSDIVEGLSYDKAIRDPQIANFVVGTQDLVKMGADAIAQQQYGGSMVATFTSMDEALAAAREALK